MEVHHHAHTARKKWTHYFWEFMMLFLAVFCGFLAEYQLEHKIERDRAKELAKSFFVELKNDSATVQLAVQGRLKKDSAIIYLCDFFQDSNLNNLPRAFGINYMLALMVQSPIIFEPRTAILDQLKNSGSLRYFKSKDLQELTGNIAVSIANLKTRQEVEQNFFNTQLGPFNIRHGDYQWLKKIRGNGQNTLLKNVENYTNNTQDFPFQLGNTDKINKTEIINMLQLYLLIIQTTRLNQFNKYITLNNRLLEELRKQYHLD